MGLDTSTELSAQVDENTIPLDVIQKETCEAIARLYVGARKELNLTQEELAKESGMARSGIARLEGGNHSPTVDFLIRLAASMGKQLDIKLVDIEKFNSF